MSTHPTADRPSPERKASRPERLGGREAQRPINQIADCV